MSHFAKVINNRVEAVIVAEQEVIDSGMFGDPNIWIKTSYNTKGGVHSQGGEPLRMNYANIGFAFDAVRDAFIPIKPYPSWVLDEQTCLWTSPIVHPNNGQQYVWDEVNKLWNLIVN